MLTKDNWGNQELPGISNEELFSDEFAKKVRYAEMGELNRHRNKDIYGTVKWIVRSPGNDLLYFYDKQNELLGKDNRAYSSIPPSVVYHYRFEHQYPPELFDKSKNYGVNSYLRDRLSHYHNTSDATYWGQVRNKRYDWLVNAPHEEFIFNTKAEALSFLKEKTGQQTIRDTLAVHSVTNKLKKENLEHLFWRGNAKGWSIIVR
jgi:hypothetical protein